VCSSRRQPLRDKPVAWNRVLTQALCLTGLEILLLGLCHIRAKISFNPSKTGCQPVPTLVTGQLLFNHLAASVDRSLGSLRYIGATILLILARIGPCPWLREAAPRAVLRKRMRR
jgi:hypothetical protein